MFKMAIAFTENAFRVAVNGNHYFTYNYRVSNSFLDTLSGIKMHPSNGLQLEIQGVDHFNTGTTDCEGFEAFSQPDAQVN